MARQRAIPTVDHYPMKISSPIVRRQFCWLLMLLIALLAGGCRKARKPERVDIENLKVVIAPELMVNRLDGLEGAVYQTFKDSPIHWQPWEASMFGRAEASKRMLFCVVMMAQQPGAYDLMSELEDDPGIVETINSHYIPVLIDADTIREMQVLCAILSDEIRRSPGFPLFMWLDYNGNPVACTPVSKGLPGGVKQVFNQSHAMIAPMWEDDLEKWLADGSPGYVINNSAHDQSNRKNRLEAAILERQFCEGTAEELHTALRELFSQYDFYAHTFSSAGGLVPTRQVGLVAQAMMTEGLPDTLRASATRIMSDMTEHLMHSAMFDPLDGGVFHTRVAKSWSFPYFAKCSTNQAGIAQSLLDASSATRGPAVLNKTLQLIQSIERNYLLDSGLFVLGATEDSDPEKWMWSVDEVRQVLGERDAKWWVRATGMKELGNLPLEADPKREMFRKNSLAMTMSMDEIAKSLSIPVADFAKQFDAARQKLLDARKARMRSVSEDTSPHLESSLMMVSVYAEAYRVTGDRVFGQKALALMDVCRKTFADGDKLRVTNQKSPEWLTAARAMHYARAINAALDAHELNSAAGWLDWAASLWLQVEEQFVSEDVILEYPKSSDITELPLDDPVMRFGDSSMGVFAVALEHSKRAGVAVPDTLQAMVSRMPMPLEAHPLLISDRLQALLLRHYARPKRQ